MKTTCIHSCSMLPSSVKRARSWLLAFALVTPGCGDEEPAGSDMSDLTPDAPDTAAPDATTSDTASDVTADTDTTPDASDDQLQWEELLRRAAAAMADGSIPGMQIAVVVGGELRHVGALGVRSWQGTEPVTDATMFRWPSGSGLLTATAAMRLVGEGKLELYRPITDVVPELGHADAVTLHQLLSETSGSRPFFVPWTGPSCSLALADYYARPLPDPLAPAGAFVIYSVHNTNLAGLAIERAAGQPFTEAMQALVFGPLGMSSATFVAADAVASGDSADGTHGSAASPEKIPLDQVDCLAMRPSLFLDATASDMGRALELLVGNGAGLLEAGAVQQMRDAGDTRWHPDGTMRDGYQMICDTGYRGVSLCSQGGGTITGFTSAIVMVPERGLAVAIVSNAGWADLEPLARGAVDLWLADLPPDLRDYSTPPSTWGKYAGTYDDPADYGTIEVTADGTSLKARFGAGAYERELVQVTGDRFRFEHPSAGSMTVLFAFDPARSDQARWFVSDAGVAELRSDPIDRLVGSWLVVDAAVVSNSCPYEVPAETGGFLVIRRVDADSGSGAFCSDAAGTDCFAGLDQMPVEAGGGSISLDYGRDWDVAGFDCRVHLTGAGALTLDGDRLDLAGTSANRVVSGAACADAEAHWQALYGNTNPLEGCEVIETIGMERYSARPEVTIDTYPRVDGSTSTLPLARAIASELFGLRYRWIYRFSAPSPGVAPELELAPLSDTSEEEEVAQAITFRIVHRKTHAAYLGLIDGTSDLILVASPPSLDELAHATQAGVTLEWRPIARDGLVFIVRASSPIAHLTSAQIQGIFTGDITRWSEVGGPDEPIHPYIRPASSGSQQLMEALVMHGFAMPEWPEDQVVSTMEGLVDRLKRDPNAIGYSVYYFVTYQYPLEGLKLVVVDGETPSPASLATGDYAFTAPVLAVTRQDLDRASAAYEMREWLLTPDGQRVVRRSGYVPAVEPSAGASTRWPAPTSCQAYRPGWGGQSCDPWSGTDVDGCPSSQLCHAEWGQACDVTGVCKTGESMTPADFGLDAVCWTDCDSGLVCTDGFLNRCRPICDPSAAQGEPCAAGERCFSRTGSQSVPPFMDPWHAGALMPIGYCAVPCTPGASQCELGRWCYPRELDPETDRWVGECFP